MASLAAMAAVGTAAAMVCACPSPASRADVAVDAGEPLRAAPCLEQEKEKEKEKETRRRRQRPTQATGDGADSAAASYGPGFAWDDRRAAPLEDAVSQIFSLCLRWRAAGETLNSFKLNKLEFILSRQVGAGALSDDALSRQRFTAALMRALLDDWASTNGSGPPQAAAARGAKAAALAADLQAAYDPPVDQVRELHPRATQEGWRHARAGAYLRWLEREMRAAEAQQLAVSPLKHVLLHYDRSLLLAGGLWLEFGVAEGATLGLIASQIPAHLADGVVIGSGESSGRCFGFDSFVGLPEAWRPGFVSDFPRRPSHRIANLWTSFSQRPARWEMPVDRKPGTLSASAGSRLRSLRRSATAYRL